MATKKSSTPRNSKAKQSNSRGAVSLDRLNDSLDAAQKALGDLQGDLGRGARDVVKNVSRLIRDARRDTAKLNRALVKDVGQLGRALTPARNGAKRTSKATAKKSTAKRASSKRAPARKS
jgi:hypothetical protein